MCHSKWIFIWALIFTSVTISSARAEQKIHKKVQEALDWKLPVHTCGDQPKLRGASQDVDSADGAKYRFDVDGVKLDRHKRKMKRWKSCKTKYNKKLMASMETLKSSAQFGLTQTQATTILGKMKQIQGTLANQEPL